MKRCYRYLLLFCFTFNTLLGLAQTPATSLGAGVHPSVSVDPTGGIHVVFGQKNKLLYAVSTDGGRTFPQPLVVDSLLAFQIGASRGPQIAVTRTNVVITVIDKPGNVLVYTLARATGNWTRRTRVNDVTDVAKEGFVTLAAGTDSTFYAVWLDLRGDQRNKLVMARSTDGGQAWSANQILYQSPDGTVCECCQPTVLAHADTVRVLFRNNLQGARDMYLLTSLDGGTTVADTAKLGQGTWLLKGCPMDGGGMAVDTDGVAVTIWRRDDWLYRVRPGELEMALAKGKNGNVTTTASGPAYVWQADGSVWGQLPGQPERLLVGVGAYPKLATLPNNRVLCVWEQDGQVVACLLN